MSLRLEAELLLRRHGTWPPVIVVAILSCLGLTWRVILPPAAVPEIVQPVAAGRVAEERARAFRALLLPRGEIDSRQRLAVEAALRHRLTVGRIDFGLENHPVAPFGMATLHMPLRGNYVDLRAFLDEFLQAHPGAAIETLNLQRDAGGNGVEARVRLVFHVQPLAGEAT
jgi:hypothetical protein